MRVEEAEVADLDEERQDRRRKRKGEAEDEVVEEKAVAEESQMREGEGRRSTTAQGQEDGQPGDGQRVASRNCQ